MNIIDKLSELLDDPIKLRVNIFLACVVGGAVIEISVNTLKWHEKRQQDEQALRVCEKMKNIRNVTIERLQRGLPVSGFEASSAYQIGVMTPENCGSLGNY